MKDKPRACSESNMKEESVFKREMSRRQAASSFSVPMDTMNRRLKKLDKQSGDNNIYKMCQNV